MTSTSVQVALFIGCLCGVALACPGGYVLSFGNCYKFSGDIKNWHDSRASCQRTGGDLAVIDTEWESNVVKELRVNTGKQHAYYWIGSRQHPDARSSFNWLNGKSMLYSLWHTGEPNNVNHRDKQCVDLGVGAQQMKMNDYPCSASLNYLCEKKCPAGWYDSQLGTCYKFVNTGKTWYQAASHCAAMGGYLAVVDTGYEATQLQQLRINTGHQNRYYWIGAIQTPNARGPFKWIPDTGSVDVGLWHAGEPNQVDHRNRQCVDLGVGAQGYKMNDYPCAAALPFLCEKPQ